MKKTIVAGWKEVPCALVVTIVVVVTRSSTAVAAAAGFVQGTPCLISQIKSALAVTTKTVGAV